MNLAGLKPIKQVMILRNSKLSIKTLIIYICAFLLLPFILANFKSGPCTPNLDMLYYGILFLGTLGMCLYYIVRYALGKETYFPNFLIHILAFLIVFFWEDLSFA